MGSAKDKHGVRESFAKVTCVFAKNDRSQIKKFWSTTIYGRAAMRGDSMWFFFAPPTGWDNIITWACAFGLWWYSEERCSYCILNLYTPYIYTYIYIYYINTYTIIFVRINIWTGCLLFEIIYCYDGQLGYGRVVVVWIKHVKTMWTCLL